MRKEVQWKVRRAGKRRGGGWGVVGGDVISIEAVYLTREGSEGGGTEDRESGREEGPRITPWPTVGYPTTYGWAVTANVVLAAARYVRSGSPVEAGVTCGRK